MSIGGTKRIWILNHHAELNGHRHYELGRHLVRLGLDVTVIASSFSHKEHKYTKEEKYFEESICNHMRYIWLRTKPAYKGNGVNRILNMLSYLLMVKHGSKQWWTKYGKPDIVIGSSVHPFAWEAAYWISKRTGAKFIAEVRDLWPLSLIEITGLSRYHPIVILFALIEWRAYQRAYKIITSMPYAYKYICQDKYRFHRNKVVWIPNGINIEQNNQKLCDSKESLPDDLEAYLKNNWCCIYAGSIVKSECVDFIIDAAIILDRRDDNNICFAIIGEGEEKEKLIETVRVSNIKNVRFFNRISKHQVELALKLGCCCCAVLHNLSIYNYGLSMNKLNDYLLSGKPTVLVCNAPNIVKESGAGISLNYGDPYLLADAILNIYHMADKDKAVMCEKGLKVIKEQYDMKIIAKKFVEKIVTEDISIEDLPHNVGS